jgi:2'-5' RNA ligase
MTRLFVAAWPTAEVIEALNDVARPPDHGVRWVPRSNWHITLRFVGDADVVDLAERLAAVALPRALAALGPAIEQLGRRQIVVPVEGVDTLARVVRSATGGIGEPDRRRFHGHLTMARLAPGAHPSALGTPFLAEFEVAEIAVVASDLRSDGAVYTTLARFPTT